MSRNGGRRERRENLGRIARGSQSLSNSRRYLAICIAAVGLTLTGLPVVASAEVLQPYPSFTHSTTVNMSQATAIDPLNVLFGGTRDGGAWGTANGVRDQLEQYTSMFDPVTGGTQYVLFKSDVGNQWPKSHEHQLATSFALTARWHVRVFASPYDTPGGSSAWHNSVGDIHHERFGDHDIDMSWEAAENSRAAQWKSDHPAFLIDADVFPNWTAGYWNDSDGTPWYTDGKMTSMRLYP